MTTLTFRPPRLSDAPAIADIDVQGLATGHATFRDTPHDWESFSKSFLTGRGLAMVAEDNTGLSAWAGISPTSTREVYQGVGEVSIYVSADKQRMGVGRDLLNAIVLASEQAGYWTLIAQIFPENEGSLALHADVGFIPVGTRRKLGKMRYGPCAGLWRDVIMLERRSTAVG